MTRTSSLAGLVFAFAGCAAAAACNDTAEVLTPDTGTPDAGSDVQSDVTTPDSDATSDAPSEATDAPDETALTCDAGLEICNNVCTDPSTYLTDAKNCGFCGHDCQGGACTAGLCAPETIGSGLPNPSHLAVDSTNVYMTMSGDGSSTGGSVYQCPIAGCPTKLGPMTASLDNPNGIAVDSSKVYWVNSSGIGAATGSVMSCPLTDCGKLDASRVTIAKKLQFVQGIALDSTNVYFDVWGASPYGSGYAGACPLAGCSGAPTQIISGQYKPFHVATNAVSLFMAAPGGSASVAYLQSNLISTPSSGMRVWTGSVQNHISGFALFAGKLYFSDDFKGEVDVCPSGLCNSAATLATNLSFPTALVVDSEGIYWIDDAGIERCPLNGCTTPSLLAMPTSSSNSATAIAVSGNYLYWVEQDGGTNGVVMRVPR